MRGPGRLQFVFWLLAIALFSAALADVFGHDYLDAGLSATFAVLAGLWASGNAERHNSTRWVLALVAGVALLLAAFKWIPGA